jgi:peptidyl-prolyl cis-trans isomerase SurA
MKKRVGSSIMAIGLLLSISVQGTASGSVVVDRVVAVVNDEVITMSDLQREEIIMKKGNAGLDKRLVLEDMIDRKLQMAAAKRSGMDVTNKELADALADIMKRNNLDGTQFEAALAREGLTLDQYKTELREQITLSRMFNKHVRSGVTMDEAEARVFYQNNLKAYALPEEIRVRQIFLRLPEKATPAQDAAVREKARMVYERAKQGEDFIRLVRETSNGVTAQQDGDLGFMQREHALPEIEEAVRSLRPGEIAGPLKFAGGYNVIRLEEMRTPVKPFDTVKDDISKTLYERKVENTYRGWLQTLRSDSHIENRL